MTDPAPTVVPANAAGPQAVRGSAMHLLADTLWSVAACVLLGSAVWVVYGAAIHAPFIFDDTFTILENPSIVKLWPLLGDSGRNGVLNPQTATATVGRPLVNLSLGLNYYLGGLDPAGYHVFNMVVHMLSAMLLWAIVRLARQLEYFGGQFERAAGPLALLVALVWAVHPLQTETVEYVTQRTEGLMGFFYLATLYGSLRYWAAPIAGRSKWLILSTMACLSGMACKEVMASAPLIVLLFERTFVAGTFRRSFQESWPLYVGLASSWLLRLGLSYLGTHATAGFDLGVPAYAWWFTQAKVLLLYLKLTVWPWPLVIHYEMPYLDTFGAAWPWLLAVGLLAIGTIVLFWRRAAVGFLGAWVFIVLSPTLVVPLTTEVAAERRMYLPLAAIVALVIVGGYRLAHWTTELFAADASPAASGRTTTIIAVAGAVVAVVLGLVSVRRLEAYRDVLTIWRDASTHQPENYLVQTNVGVESNNAGRPQEAIEHFERALRLRPDYADSHKNLAQSLAAVGRAQEAIEHFQRALELNPSMVAAHAGLAIALTSAGRLPEAIEQYDQALRIEPGSSTTHNNLGVALLRSERPQEAIAQFKQAVRLDPNYLSAYTNLLTTCAAAGQSADAIATAEAAVKVARSQNQAKLAGEIETWLSSYRRGLSKP